jgi:hypothetical protein
MGVYFFVSCRLAPGEDAARNDFVPHLMRDEGSDGFFDARADVV